MVCWYRERCSRAPCVNQELGKLAIKVEGEQSGDQDHAVSLGPYVRAGIDLVVCVRRAST